MVKLEHQAGQALALSEARKQELVECNGHKPGQRHLKRLVVEHRYTQQRQAEQNEINRDAETGRRAVLSTRQSRMLLRPDLRTGHLG